MVNYLFRKSNIPTIHWNTNGNKTLMEKKNFFIVLDVVTKIVETHTDYENLSNKKKNYWKFMFFTDILKDFQNINQTTQFTNIKSISLIDDSIDVIVFIDGFFERFMIIDNNTDKEYKFGKLIDDNNPSNNPSFTPHTKSHHTVNGFYRNQPYGSRENPKYKRIWVDSFQRGGKKVS